MRLVLALLASSGLAEIFMSPNCLVLTDLPNIEQFTSNYSLLLSTVESLCSDGSTTVKTVSDTSVHLQQFGHYLYSNIVLAVEQPKNLTFPRVLNPSMEPEYEKFRTSGDELQAAKLLDNLRSMEAQLKGPGLALEDLTKFVDNGGNLAILAQGGDGSGIIFDTLLAKFGLKIAATSLVYDYFGNESDIIIASPLNNEPWTGLISGNVTASIKGSPITMSSNNTNVFPILRASETAIHSGTVSQGSSLTLAAANQALNGARMLAAGSLEALKLTANKEWITNVLSWTFCQRALLRARDLYHHKLGETHSPRMYREKDQMVVGITIEELGIDGQWRPFPAKDLQLEYVMLDPHVRAYMEFVGDHHRLEFKVPDVYGIFKFRIEYNRLGYNPILVEQVAPIRNYRHNDYDRFLFCAYPYYASCFVTLGLVLAFSVVFINHKEPSKQD